MTNERAVFFRVIESGANHRLGIGFSLSPTPTKRFSQFENFQLLEKSEMEKENASKGKAKKINKQKYYLIISSIIIYIYLIYLIYHVII